MGIYRGAGGTGDAVADSSSEALLVRELAVEVQADADTAAASATSAATSATNAATSATNASNSATAAATSETNAANSASSMSSSVAAAAASATAAAGSATTASTQATNASNSASAASTSATNAASSASTATTQATNASNSASAASTSATNASNSASAAATSATNAASSATSASGSATTATTQASNASSSATAAASSATSASGSATTATTQAGIATTKASEAATSATAAAGSATSASGSASAAATSATNASNSADNAFTSETNASNSANDASAFADNASASATAAAASAASIDDANLVHLTGTETVSGAKTFSSTTTLSGTANLSFSGTGQRIIGDFTSGTFTNRVGFQTSTANSATLVAAMPSGTGNRSGLWVYNNSDPTNASRARFEISNTVASINSDANGTGTSLPLTINTVGVERMRIDTAGNVGIGTAAPVGNLSLYNSSGTNVTVKVGDHYGTGGYQIPLIESFGSRNDANTTFQGRFGAAYRRTDGSTIASESTLGTYGFGGQWGTDTTYQSAKVLYPASIRGVTEGAFTSASAMPTAIAFHTGLTGGDILAANTAYGIERARVDSKGNLLVGTTSSTTPSSDGFISTANSFGFKNRIINGNFAVDQRSAGAAVTIPASGFYSVDRWFSVTAAASKFSMQKLGDATFATEQSTYLRITSLAATTPGAADVYQLKQSIEGINAADFAFGTANAQPIALSFWVRSSLTGTFGGAIAWGGTGGNERSYPFSYSIPVANTWTQVGILIPADTTASTNPFNTGTSIAFQVRFGLGVGATNSGTAGSWSLSNWHSATGAVAVVGTSGATWDISAVQFEKGTVCTTYDVIPYSTQLAHCQRYYYQANNPTFTTGAYRTTTVCENGTLPLPTTMRASPTVTATSGTGGVVYVNGSATPLVSVGLSGRPDIIYIGATTAAQTQNWAGYAAFTSGNNLFATAEI